MTIPTMVTIKEASQQSGLSYDFVRRLCLQGKIAYIRVGTKYLINLERFIEFLNTGEGRTSENNMPSGN